MTKNKKKLRRIERRTPGYAARAAQTLVLAGLLMTPALAGAAAVTVGESAAWTQENVSKVAAGELLTVTSTDGKTVVTNAAAGDTLLGGLKVDSGSTQSTTLELGANFTVKETLQIVGSQTDGKTATLDTKGFNLSVNGLTTIGDEGTLKISDGSTFATLSGGGVKLGAANTSTLEVAQGGLLMGKVTLDGAKGTISLGGDITGDVELAGTGTAADATLTTTDHGAKIDGKLTVSKGTVAIGHNTAVTGLLTINNATAANAALTVTGKATKTDIDFATLTATKILVGSDDGTKAGSGGGSLVLDTLGDMDAEEVSLYGRDATTGIAKLELKGTDAGSHAEIGTLNVGSAAAFGSVSIAGKAAGDTSVLLVDKLNLGDNGQILVDAHGVLSIGGDYEMTGTALTDTAASGKIAVAADGVLQVREKLTLTQGTASTGVSAAVGGTVMADTLKAYNTTDKAVTGLAWEGGTLQVLGDGTDKALDATSLTVDKGATVVLGDLFSRESEGGTFAGEITLTDGTLLVENGPWTLTNAGKSLDLGANGALEMVGGKLDLALGDGKDLTVKKAAGLAIDGGMLKLTGNLVNSGSGTIALSGTGMLDVSGNLTAAVNDGVTVGETSSLTVGGNASITGAGTNGGVYVDGGTVTVTGLTDIGASGVLHVKEGSYTTDSIKTIASSGTSLVGGGSAEAKLVVNGTTAGTSVQTVDSKIKLGGLGAVEVQYAAALDDKGTVKMGTIDADSTSGALILKGGPDSMTLTDYAALKSSLLTNGGTLRLEGTTIEAGAKEDFTKVDGVSVPGTVGDLGTTTATTTKASGTELKGLTIDSASANTFTVDGKGATVALVGGAKSENFQLITNTNASPGATTLVAKDGGSLTLGQHNGQNYTHGTAKADVEVSGGGTFTAVNGNFTVDGTITDDTGGGTVTVTGAGTKLDVTGGMQFDKTNSELHVTGGYLGLGADSTLVKAVVTNAMIGTSLDKNLTIDTAEVTGGGIASLGTLKIDNATVGTGGALSATGAMTLGATNLKGGTILAFDALTVNAFNNGAAGKVSDAMIIVEKGMTVTTGNLDASGVTLNVGGELKMSAAGVTITADKASDFNVGTLKVDGTNLTSVAVKGGSSLTVDALSGSANGTITIGTSGADVTDGSTLNAKTTNLNGSTLKVENAKASLGELTAATGTLFVDPAFVQVDNTKGTIGAALLMGTEGVLAVGSVDEAWVRTAIAQAKAPADSSVLALQKGVTLDAAGKIVVDKGVGADGKIGATAISGVHFGNKSLLAIDGSQFLTTAAITADSGHVLFTSKTAGEEARLHITNVKTGETVKVVGGLANNAVDLDDAEKSWQNGNISFDTALFKGTGVTNAAGTVYDVTVSNVGATNVFPRLHSSLGGVVDNMLGQYGLRPDHDNAGVRFLSRAVSDSYGLGAASADRAAATIEGAAQMAAVGGVQLSTIGAVNAAAGAVTTRTSFAQPLMDMTKAVAVHQDADGTLSLDSGLSAGNGMKNGLGVWIMPLYQSNRTWGMKAENFKTGMNSDLGGVAFGADYTVNDMFRFGAAFNIGAGYAQSTGDFNETENRFNFWGVNLYGGWTMNNFGLSADVGYTGNYNKVEQDMPASMQMGNLKADVTSSAWTAGLKAEYKFETSVVDIIPHVGARYMGLTTDEYSVKSGGTVFEVDKEFQSIWTFPVGVAFSKTLQSDSGWMFKPQLDLSVIPAAGDVKTRSKSRIPGVNGESEMKMQVVDYVTFDGGVGFEVGKDNLSFGLNYNVQASEHRTGHGVFGTLRYEF